MQGFGKFIMAGTFGSLIFVLPLIMCGIMDGMSLFSFEIVWAVVSFTAFMALGKFMSMIGF